jgi:hypothetical protein
MTTTLTDPRGLSNDELLARAANVIEHGGYREGGCTECTYSSWSSPLGDCAPGDYHDQNCVVRELRRRAGEVPASAPSVPQQVVGSTDPGGRR